MSTNFAGWTAERYSRYRRDVPDPVVEHLVQHFALGSSDRVLDLGAGTGQLLLPLVRRVGPGIGLDPEPDMLRLLRKRALAEQADVVALLAADTDLQVLRTVLGDGSVSLVTAANSLHWMNAGEVIGQAHRLLRPGGGIAVVSHGLPLWLMDTPWARALNLYLQQWLGQPTGSMCGVDDATRDARAELMRAAGFHDVSVHRHRYQAMLSEEYIVGHLFSALSEEAVPVDRRSAFEQGVLSTLRQHRPASGFIEDTPVVTLVGVRQ